ERPGFECASGSSKIGLGVPKQGAVVPIRIEGGSVRTRLRRPMGRAIRVDASGGSVRLTADGVRQGGFGSIAWQSPGADASSDRYEARFSGGSVVVDVEQG